MATNAVVTVGMASPTSLASGLKRVILQNKGDYGVALGGSSVTYATGLQMDPHSRMEIPVALAALETLYAIVQDDAPTSTTCDIVVLGYTG